MGMIRCNVPSIFIYGGSSLPGRIDRQDPDRARFHEAVGSFTTGEIDAPTLERIERSCLPTIGACAGQFTANTLGMVSEAMGLTIPNVSMIPGVYAERAQVSRRAGRLIMEMLEQGGPLPREIVTPEGARERRSHRCRDGRFDQCGLAFAGACERGGHCLHDRRRRRGLRQDAADRKSAAGRQVHGEGRLRYRRCGRRHPRVDPQRAYRRQLPDGDGPDPRRGIRRSKRA